MVEDKVNEIPETILTSLQRIIEKENFLTFQVSTNKVVTNDNNYMGELYASEIQGVTDEGEKELHIFYKYIIDNDYQLCSLHEVYKKEVFVYKELGKTFERLQNEAEVPEKDRFNMAKCYDETNTKCIILENLAVKGYKTLPIDEVMSLEFTQVGIVQLAKFHALSFVLEKKHPDFFEEKVKTLKASLKYDDYWTKFAAKMSGLGTSKFDGDIKIRLDNFLKLSEEKYPKYATGLNSNLKCLCHGDYKMNNILHKKENGRITRLVPIDYQHVYYGCPIMDFYFFIYTATDVPFRSDHLSSLRALYYETLSNFLEYFNIDFNSICSKSEMENIFDDSRDYGLMFSLYILPLFYIIEAPTAKDDLVELDFNLDDNYYERITEVVKEFMDLNIL